MQPPKWPKLPHTNPTDLEEHAASLGDSFKAVQEFLQTGVSDVAPTLPKGIEHKIKEGITRGLVEVEGRDYSTTCISVDDRDLISNAIFEETTPKPPPPSTIESLNTFSKYFRTHTMTSALSSSVNRMPFQVLLNTEICPRPHRSRHKSKQTPHFLPRMDLTPMI